MACILDGTGGVNFFLFFSFLHFTDNHSQKDLGFLQERPGKRREERREANLWLRFFFVIRPFCFQEAFQRRDGIRRIR